MEKVEKGIESLKKSVLVDCNKEGDCFNESGCDKESAAVKCRYWNKYKWIMERADHYAEKTGTTREEILKVWEENRGYWYMNYYQDSNFPLLDDENIILYDDWIKELKNRFSDNAKRWGFVCPSCGNTQTAQDFIDAGIEPEGKAYFSCIGRYTEGKGCDWTLGGLFKIHKQAVLKNGVVHPVFEMAPAE